MEALSLFFSPGPCTQCFKASQAWASWPRVTMLPFYWIEESLQTGPWSYINEVPSWPSPSLGQQVAWGCDLCLSLLWQEAAVHGSVERPHQLPAVTFGGPSKSVVTHYPSVLYVRFLSQPWLFPGFWLVWLVNKMEGR